MNIPSFPSIKSTESDRKSKEGLAAALKEKERRYQRKIQSERGGLLHFVRYMWRVLEPSTTFVEGWAFEAICLHLEAVTFGEINRLLINVPPGFSKSLLTQVFWPAWEWSAMDMPGNRYVGFAYSSFLTERDNDRFCKLIQSERFQDIWGNKFTLTAEGKVKIANNKTGWKFASSVGGVGTGERGDRVICFPEDEVVQTEIGPIPIGEIVEKRRDLRVWSQDMATGEIELKPVVGWHKNQGSPIVEIVFSDGASIRCTPDHRIWTRRGWIEAGRLQSGDMLPPSPIFNAPDGVSVDTEPAAKSNLGIIRLNDLHDLRTCELGTAMPLPPSLRHRVLGQDTDSNIGPSVASSHASNRRLRYAKLFGQVISRYISAFRDFNGEFLGNLRVWFVLMSSMRSVSLRITDILRRRAIGQIAQSGVLMIPVKMADLVALWARTNERAHNHLVSIGSFWNSVSAKGKAGISNLSRDSWRENFLTNDHWKASPSVSPHDIPSLSSTSTKIADAIEPLVTEDRFPIFVREFGHAESTYCLTIPDHHTFFVGMVKWVLVANCDDPGNLIDAQSTIVRDDTNRWFEESVQNRLNDLRRSAIIVIMQRLHENDVSGLILEKFPNYHHLMIAMEHEIDRHCTTYIGWSDPRTREGELAWPERFPIDTLRQFKANEYLWAGQYQQRPQLRGSAILKSEYWQPWDEESSVENGVKYGLYPPFEYVVGCLDTAMTEKKQNDPSAFLALGVWRNKNNNRRIMLIYAWTERFEFHDLINQIVRACKKCKITLDKLLVEAKANGHSVEQELRRLHQNNAYEAGNPLALTSIQLWNPGRGDKVSRAMAIQPIMERRVVFYPTRTGEDGSIIPRVWAQAVERQASSFPRGKHDDLVDCLTMGLAHLRLIGMIATPEEEREVLRQELSDYKTPLPLYPGA